MTKHSLIFIHGMGEGSSKVSYDMLWENIKRFSERGDSFDEEFEMVDVEWQTVPLQAERYIFHTAFPQISRDYQPKFPRDLLRLSLPVKWFMTFFVGDIIAYASEPANRNGIREKVWERIQSTCENGPYSILAHSLGSIIAFDFMYKLFVKGVPLFETEAEKKKRENGKRTEEDEIRIVLYQKNFRHLFTFGSPIGLFLLRQGDLWLDKEKPFSGLINPVPKRHTWFNFYDRQDLAAYPLRDLFDANRRNRSRPLEDIEVQTGNLIYNSHTNYWENKTMARKIAAAF